MFSKLSSVFFFSSATSTFVGSFFAEDGFATTRKEGRFVYVSKGAHESPFSLEAAFA